MRIIAVEEHWTNSYFMKLRLDWIERSGIHMTLPKEELQRVNAKVFDLDNRVKEMDSLGIEKQILVSGSNGTEGIKDPAEAIKACMMFNDSCQKEISRYSGRFGAYAVLPMQDPKASAEELERAIKEYGFVGGRISGFVQGHFLDEELFAPFWEKANELNAILYLHPTETPVSAGWLYRDCPELLGPAWSWGVDTATYLMRLAVRGILDTYPKVRIIIGHMGEMIPYILWRLENRLKIGCSGNAEPMQVTKAIKRQVYISTSGNLSEAALRCAITEFGIENILFSVDYPYEEMDEAIRFICQSNLTGIEREMIFYNNAAKIFGYTKTM